MRKRYETAGADEEDLGNLHHKGDYQRRKNIHSISIVPSVLFLLFLLGLYGIASWLNDSLPTPLKITDEKDYPNAFISERAQHAVKMLTSFGPRTTGSYENEALAVDFLKRELSFIQQQANANQRIEVDVQTASGSYFLNFKPGVISAYGNIQNVIVKLHSRNNSKHSLLINSHFDSVPGSPGGGDAALMCAIMLEVLRKLSRLPDRPEHNIIFLFNGAEETPLQASHGFITQHKWIKELSVLINLDSGGASGKEMVMQAGPGYPWLLKYYYQIPRPFAQSTAEELFQSGIIPSDTDFRIFRDFGNMIGLDIVFFKDGYRYHTSHDGFTNIPLGSYQHAGDNLLSLIHNLGNAPELFNPKQQEKENFVFYDFFELILISYSEITAVLMHFGVTLLSIAVALKSFYDFNLRLSVSSVKYLALTTGTVLASWIVSGVLVVGIAKMLDILQKNLAWYGHPWIIFGLYVAPVLCCCCIFMTVLNNYYKKSPLSISTQSQIQIHIVRLLWTAILLIGTYFRIRSIYLIFLLLIFQVLVAILIQALSLQHSVTQWKVVHIFGLLVPALFLMKHTQQGLDAIVPISGRMGSILNSEYVIGAFTVMFTILIVSSYIPLITVTQKPWLIIKLLVGVFLIAFMILFTPLGFPYSGDPQSPKPQRYWVYHTSRVFRNDTNEIYKKDSGYFMFNWDRNSPNSIRGYVKSIDKARSIAADCDRSLFCGVSVLSPKMIPILRESTLIPAGQPIIHDPISLKLNSKMEISDNVTRFSFTASGPSQFTVFVSARPGVKLVRTNLIPELPKSPIMWNDRPIYVALYTWGKEKTPLNVTFDFETPPNWTFPTFDIALTGSYKDEKTFVRTPHFVQFLKEFPDWTDVTSWVAAYESWVY